MTDRHDEPRDSDEAIWREASTLSPADTRDAKIHVTLRLDPGVYRAILAEKKASGDRTITSTIERILGKGLRSGSTDDSEAKAIRDALRNLVVHSIGQDAVLRMVSRHLKPRSLQDRRIVEAFRNYSFDAESMERWLMFDWGEPLASRDLMQALSEAEAVTPRPQKGARRKPK
jgi:hypothetical protein